MLTVYVVNPRSGAGKGAQLYAALEELRRRGELHGEILRVGDTTDWAHLRDCDRLLIGGGDGTLSHLLPHLLGGRAQIGLLPLGTANDLARELGVCRWSVHRRVQTALKQLETAHPRALAVFRVRAADGQEALFCNYLSLGLDAAAVAGFDRWRNCSKRSGRLLNRLMYLRAALPCLNSCITSGEVRRESNKVYGLAERGGVKSIFVANIRAVAGIARSNPVSNPFDHAVEVSIIERLHQYVPVLCRHRVPLGRPKMLGAAKRWSIEGLPPGVALQIDGEARSDMQSTGYEIEYAGDVRVLTCRG